MKPIQNYINQVLRLTADRRKRRAILSVLAVLVAAGVAWQLRLSGLTLNDTACGLEAHTHSVECYGEGTESVLSCTPESVGIHVHTPECRDAEQKLICGKADYMVHIHTAECSDAEGNRLCGLPQVVEHSHTDSCYQPAEPEHVHEDGCYEWLEPESTECIIPETEGHAHGEGCWQISETPVCGQEAAEGHAHGEGCWQASETPICGLEATEGHAHGEGCWQASETPVCGQEESETHAHGDGCYQTLTCTTPEAQAHAHDETGCFKTLICTTPESQGHAHDETGCYQTLICTTPETPAHSHDETCTPKVKGAMLCGYPEEIPQELELVCQLPEVALHTHDEKECYQRPALCGQEHDHVEECYGEPELICEKLEVLAHVHGEGCYTIPPVLSCTLPEHAHDDSCAPVFMNPITTRDTYCGEEEHIHTAQCYHEAPAGHAHEDGCYEWVTPETTDCTQEHTHDDTCTPKVKGSLICGLEEQPEPQPELVCEGVPVAHHVHDDSCYDAPLVCETEHEHTAECYGEPVLICQVPEEQEHVHGEECYGIPEILNCTHAEHTHTDSCYQEPAQPTEAPTEATGEATEATQPTEAPQPTEAQPLVLTYTGEDFTITATCQNPAALPQGVTMSVREILPDTEEYATCHAQASEALAGQTIQQARFFDITFLLGDQEVEPTSPVEINISYHQVQAITPGSDIKAVHFGDNGTELLDVEAQESENGLLGLTYSQDSFSISGFVTTVTNSTQDEAPDALPVDYYLYLDNQWQLVGSTAAGWLSGSPEGYDLVALSQVESVLQPYGFQANQAGVHALAIQPKAEGATLFTATAWSDKDGVPCLPMAKNASGYSLYYLPNNQGDITGASLSELDGPANAFYSVTVLDPEGLVYADASEIPGRLILVKGSKVELLLRNAQDVKWEVTGAAVTTQRQSFGSVTVLADDGTEQEQEITGTLLTIASLQGTTQVLATEDNPKFTVQYYANLNVGSDEDHSGKGWTETLLVDTRNGGTGSGGKVAKNDSTNSVMTLYIDPSTNRFPLAMSKQTKFFSDMDFEYLQAPSMKFVNQLQDNENYKLVAVWVAKKGTTLTSTTEADFTVYKKVDEIGFTTIPSEANENTILIEEGTVIRLVYDPVPGTFSNAATFYDYDITDGKFYQDAGYTQQYTVQPGTSGSIVYANTNKQGINSNSNYTGSGAKLGFGNNNTNSGMADQTWGNVTPNKANPKSFGDGSGCTYGLVVGLNQDGTLKYASGIQAPKLFNETGAVVGKTTHPGYSLNFYRNGDTYTLQSVSNKDKVVVTGDLTQLIKYEENSRPSNNFWPMDSVSYWKSGGGMSPGHDLAFGDATKYVYNTATGAGVTGGWRRYGSSMWTALPAGDDGRDHNSYFGMNFSLNFSLTQNYVGPLEYAFYGDDDLWIILTYPDGTSKVICDIGGVHTSMGQYVDLWDWIKKEDPSSEGLYTLSGFYTERGASGSTCWMNFTLPSVSSIDVQENTGNLEISKVTQDGEGNTLDINDVFQFQVELKTSQNGESLGQQYRYPVTITYADGSTKPSVISPGGTISLYAGESALIKSIPVGTYYTVTELTRAGYSTMINNQAGYIASGTITSGGSQEANFINIPGTQLPDTGGIGLLPYAFGGVLTLMSALMYTRNPGRKQRKGGRRTRQ